VQDDGDCLECHADHALGDLPVGRLKLSQCDAKPSGDQDHTDDVVVYQRPEQAVGNVVQQRRDGVGARIARLRRRLKRRAVGPCPGPDHIGHQQPDPDRDQRVENQQKDHPWHDPTREPRLDERVQHRDENQRWRKGAEQFQNQPGDSAGECDVRRSRRASRMQCQPDGHSNS
jgi:hypothetical protein